MEENKEIEVYCKCGKKLNPNWKVCPQCNAPVFYEEENKKRELEIEQEKKQAENKKHKGITLLEVIILLTIIAFLLFITPHVIIWAIQQK